MKKRASGILLHISSLPSNYGIGSLGRSAYEFVDMLAESGQKYWQILPVGPTLYGDSPYQSPSAFAGNPYFIDLDLLIDDGILSRDECNSLFWGGDAERVDYGALYEGRCVIFDLIANRFDRGDDSFAAFCDNNFRWLDDYAVFAALKEENGGGSWNTLSVELKRRDEGVLNGAIERLSSVIHKHKILQYLFFKQWRALRSYASERDVRIIGDMPIYVAYDSADVWSHSDLFKLDESLTPTVVAGCPPDGFSPLGQRWGNPIYDWQNNREKLFSWWASRISHSLRIYDVIRIDHFRGFSAYYEIPEGEETAVNGYWLRGPGIELFRYIKDEIGELPIIAEDLGFIDDEVKRMLIESGFPGMRVLQFAFDSMEDNDYLPHNYSRNCVIYTGTHDNDTLIGWIRSASDSSLWRVKKYLGLPENADYGSIAEAIIRSALSSVGDTAIIPIQDILGLGSEARMNTPSSTEGNWRFRLPADYRDRIDRNKLREYTSLYGR